LCYKLTLCFLRNFDLDVNLRRKVVGLLDVERVRMVLQFDPEKQHVVVTPPNVPAEHVVAHEYL